MDRPLASCVSRRPRLTRLAAASRTAPPTQPLQILPDETTDNILFLCNKRSLSHCLTLSSGLFVSAVKHVYRSVPTGYRAPKLGRWPGQVDVANDDEFQDRHLESRVIYLFRTKPTSLSHTETSRRERYRSAVREITDIGNGLFLGRISRIWPRYTLALKHSHGHFPATSTASNFAGR